MSTETKPTYEQLEHEVAFLREREQHFAQALGVADGGQYRNDWDASIRRVLREREAWRKRFPKYHYNGLDDLIERKPEHR